LSRYRKVNRQGTSLLAGPRDGLDLRLSLLLLAEKSLASLRMTIDPAWPEKTGQQEREDKETRRSHRYPPGELD
jgi:hypothetical protein